ncbi:hypothetical protein C2S51_034464 [Perilla frutescens var. frutescens]|nr:hypothetical protein C2S51_034464 [Perilla frutescens var. frutescens]
MMSADLELRLPIIKMTAPPPSSDKTDADSDSCISEEDCLTPKSREHMIPPVLCCPPAPRKPLRRRSCKRKLMSEQLDFFEVVAKDEVESFFRRAEENIGAAKRRCLV